MHTDGDEDSDEAFAQLSTRGSAAGSPSAAPAAASTDAKDSKQSSAASPAPATPSVAATNGTNGKGPHSDAEASDDEAAEGADEGFGGYQSVTMQVHCVDVNKCSRIHVVSGCSSNTTWWMWVRKVPRQPSLAGALAVCALVHTRCHCRAAMARQQAQLIQRPTAKANRCLLSAPQRRCATAA